MEEFELEDSPVDAFIDAFNRLNAGGTALPESDFEPRTLEEIFARDALIAQRNAESPWREMTLEDLFKADALPLVADDAADGSYEARLDRIRDAVFRGCGCSRKATHNASGARDVTPMDGPITQVVHALSVLDTFDDYALVRCADEHKVWRVPFRFDDSGAVYCGQYQEQVEFFHPIGDEVAQAHGGAPMAKTLEELFNGPQRRLRKVDDSALAASAIDMHGERTLNGQIDALDTMISASRGIVAMYKDDPVETMSEETKSMLREANRSLDASLELKANLERSRAGASASPQVLAKSASVVDAVEAFTFAKRRFDDAVDGKLGRLSSSEQQSIRQAYTRCEMLLAEARASR